MSRLYPFEEFSRAVRENDLKGLENAIFFLGAKVHILPLWCNMTAIVYASRLGHLEQVKLLLNDLERYSPEWNDIRFKIMCDVFREVLNYHEKDPQFIEQVFERLYQLMPRNDTWFLKIVIDKEVPLLLNKLLEKTQGRHHERMDEEILKLSLDKAKRNIIPESVRESIYFQDEMNKQRWEEPVRTAMWEGNHDELRRIFKYLSDCFKDASTLAKEEEWISTNFFKFRVKGSGFAEAIIEYVAQLDDVDVYKTIVDPETIEYAQASFQLNGQELFNEILKSALQRESRNILPLVMADKRYQKPKWLRVYYKMLAEEKMYSSRIVKPLADFDDEDDAKFVYEEHILGKTILGALDPGISVPEFLEVVEAMELVSPDEHEDPDDSNWKEHVKGFPLFKGRADLVQPLLDHGYGPLGYTVAEVYQSMNSDVESQDERYEITMSGMGSLCSLESPNLYFHFLERMSENGELKGDFMVPVRLCDPWWRVDEDHPLGQLLYRCIRETGLVIQPDSGIIPDYHYAVIDKLRKFRSVRNKSLNLQKLCRRNIREILCDKTRVNGDPSDLNITDAVLSLHVANSLPKPLVNYLLFREDSARHPLYYQLFPGDRYKLKKPMVACHEWVSRPYD